MLGCSRARRAQPSRDQGPGSAVLLLQMDEELAGLVEFINSQRQQKTNEKKKKKGHSVFSG